MVVIRNVDEVIKGLIKIEEDDILPKSIKIKLRTAIEVLTNGPEGIDLRVSKSLEELGDVAEDPNVPDYARTQIWRIVSLLESEK